MKHSLLTVVVLFAVGCATRHVPPEKFAESEAGLSAAEAVGASSVPDAKLHLQLAKDQIARAKELSNAGDERAEWLLVRAAADAELALALAREARVTAEANRAMDEVKKLQGTTK